MTRLRPRSVLVVASGAAAEPSRRLALALLLGLGCLACFAVSGCMGCGTMVIQGRTLTPGEVLATAKSAGLYLAAFYSAGAVGLLSFGLFTGELASRTIHLVLSRPLSRAEYLTGRATAMLVPCVASPLLLSLTFAGTLALAGGAFAFELPAASLLLVPTLACLSVLMGALGLLVPSAMAVMLGWGAAAASVIAATETVRLAVWDGGAAWTKAALLVCRYAMPPVGQNLALARHLVSGDAPSAADFLAIPWQLGYLCALMGLSYLAFRRKDL